MVKIEVEKVEMFWGTSHDIIGKESRKTIASLWTLNEAQSDEEFLAGNLELKKGLKRGEIWLKKVPDGIWDIVIDIKKFNRRSVSRVLAKLSQVSQKTYLLSS